MVLFPQRFEENSAGSKRARARLRKTSQSLKGRSEQWRSSELLKFAKHADKALVVFSNAPDFIFTLTAKSASMIPHKIDPDSRKANERYADDIAAMGEQLKKTGAVLIYFKDEGRLWYLPSQKELEAALPLQVIRAARDGTIYSLKGSGLESIR